MLPISHDEVVHGKGQLVNKFPGDRWQKMATLRALYGFMWAHPGKKLLFMGCEFAQNDEWSESAGLQWNLIKYPEHQGVQSSLKDLNHLYKKIPALWQKDTDPSGFSWLVGNDSAANVVAFSRWDESGKPLVSVTNFSPVPHDQYQLPFPSQGHWREIINTDDLKYGGSGIKNSEILVLENGIATVKIPPLATIWFERF